MKNILKTIGVLSFVLLVALGSYHLNVPAFPAFNGAAWFDRGFHYIDDDEISIRSLKINAPQELSLSQTIEQSTPLCTDVDSGYCQLSVGQFTTKSLVSPAIEYKPAIPDRQEIIGYCTLCRDGTFSPSCAVGRGACSWHDGVAAYGVAKYRTIYGSPAVEAKDAIFSYTPKSYKDSTIYREPSKPSLQAIANHKP